MTLTRNSKMLFRTAAFLLIPILICYGLIKAQPFLAPFVTAIILSLMLLPLARKLEKYMKRGWASFLSAFILFLCSLGFLALVSLQVKSFVEDWPQIKEKMQPKIEQAREFIVKNSPLKKEDLQPGSQTGSGEKSGSGSTQQTGKSSVAPTAILGKVTGFIGNFLLTFIYIFFLLNYRRRFRIFILRIFSKERREEVKNTVDSSAKVAPRYLRGKLILMGLLAVLYSIGLGISGVNNFIVISIIAALLTLIPYIGNIIGFGMAVAFGFLTTGSTMTLVGITLTFAVAQFVESYILEPYLLGDEVDVHPFFVILIVVIGNLLWGVIGMILAIPILGIITIVLMHIKPLKAVGLLLSKKKMTLKGDK